MSVAPPVTAVLTFATTATVGQQHNHHMKESVLAVCEAGVWAVLLLLLLLLHSVSQVYLSVAFFNIFLLY